MTIEINETPMLHTYTIEADVRLADAMRRRIESLNLSFSEHSMGETHMLFVIDQNTESEREAVRTIGRQIAAYEQQQYEKVAGVQTLEEAKKLRRLNLIRMFTLRQPLATLPGASQPAQKAPEKPSQAPTIQ